MFNLLLVAGSPLSKSASFRIILYPVSRRGKGFAQTIKVREDYPGYYHQALAFYFLPYLLSVKEDYSSPSSIGRAYEAYPVPSLTPLLNP